jgi:hypothetical protein
MHERGCASRANDVRPVIDQLTFGRQPGKRGRQIFYQKGDVVCLAALARKRPIPNRDRSARSLIQLSSARSRDVDVLPVDAIPRRQKPELGQFQQPRGCRARPPDVVDLPA